MNKRYRVLVAPLDWGLGHSSRCIPIIKSLINKDLEVVIGGSGNSLELLMKEFPRLEVLSIESYPLRYPSSGNFHWHFIKHFPKMWAFIKKEKAQLHDLITNHSIDAVISDNRYGLFNEAIPSIFITHQVSPRVGIFSWLAKTILKRLIERFDQCWVPDFESDPIAGTMSVSAHLSIPVNYIGPLSRFKPGKSEKITDILVIISGPEPHRTEFENTVYDQLITIEGSHVLVRGTKTPNDRVELKESISLENILSSKALNDHISSSKYVITRCGYSSVMDLMKLGRTALLVPTKNQPEQEYLAQHLSKKGHFVFQNQNKLDIKKGLFDLKLITPITPANRSNSLDEVLHDFCDSLY